MWTVHTFPKGSLIFSQIGRLEWQLFLPIGATLGVIGLGVWAFLRAKKWREELAQEDLLAPQEQLDHYQQLVDDGLLDPQEFARIKEQLEKLARPQEPDAKHQPPDTSFPE